MRPDCKRWPPLEVVANRVRTAYDQKRPRIEHCPFKVPSLRIQSLGYSQGVVRVQVAWMAFRPRDVALTRFRSRRRFECDTWKSTLASHWKPKTSFRDTPWRCRIWIASLNLGRTSRRLFVWVVVSSGGTLSSKATGVCLFDLVASALFKISECSHLASPRRRRHQMSRSFSTQHQKPSPQDRLHRNDFHAQ